MAATGTPSALNSLPISPSPAARRRLLVVRSTKSTLAPNDPHRHEAFPSRVRAVAGGGDQGNDSNLAMAEGAKAEAEAEPTELDKLKQTLIDLLYGTDRELKASSETRMEIVEVITQIEAKNPTPAPTEALSLNGNGSLSVSVIGVWEAVEAGEGGGDIADNRFCGFTVQNSVQFTGSLAIASVTTNAKFEV